MSIAFLADSGSEAGDIHSSPVSAAVQYDSDGNWIVTTAVITASETLKLITWRIDPSGAPITRLHDSGDQAGSASVAALALAAGPLNASVASAVRTADGSLKLIGWTVDTSSGKVTRLGNDGVVVGPAREIAMTGSPLGDGRFIVAIRNGNGKLALTTWEIDKDGYLKRFDEANTSTTVESIAMCGGRNGKFYTASRDGAGSLVLIAWKLDANGTLARLGDSGNQADGVSLVDVVRLPDDNGFNGDRDSVVTAVRDSHGNLKLIAWKVSANGETVTRISFQASEAGEVTHLSCGVFQHSAAADSDLGSVVTTVRLPDNRSRLIAWKVDAGGSVARSETFSEHTGAVSGVSGMTRLGNDMFLFSVRDAEGRMKLVTCGIDRIEPQVLRNDLELYGIPVRETTARVVAPRSPDLPRGRVVLNLGGNGHGDGHAGELERDLLDPTGAFAASAPTVLHPVMLDLATQAWTADNQIIRLQDGSLMAVRNGDDWGTAGLSPAPEWFGQHALFNQTSKNARNVVFLLRSTDAGHSWSLHSEIDSAKIEGGKYGWPQLRHPGTPDEHWGVGGFDRTELYQDPWTRAIYVSGHGGGGPYLKPDGTTVNNRAGIIFRWNHSSNEWDVLHEFESTGTPFMTSTARYPLVVMQVVSGIPVLFHMKEGGSLKGPKTVAALDAATPIREGTDEHQSGLKAGPACIARVNPKGDADRVWMAYPTLNSHQRQIYKVCLVTFHDTMDPIVENFVTIEADDPSRQSCLLGTFIQNDPVDSNHGNPHNYTVFYWIEARPEDAADQRIYVRYKLFFGGTGHSQSRNLSVSDGARRPFDRTSQGDYFSGGYFEWGGKVHFLAQWNEPGAITANVVSI